MEVHAGDWALLRVKDEIDLPALTVDTSFAYDFADPIFRLGNDYSKGISVSTGYVGQHTSNGLVTALTDYPALNMHVHTGPLRALAYLLGVEGTATGLRVTPRKATRITSS